MNSNILSYSRNAQAVSQANECGDYGFPVNMICSNLNGQSQGYQNDVAITTSTPDSDTNYRTPFP